MAQSWLGRIAVVLMLLASSTASATSAFLSGNSPLGENRLEGGLHQVSLAISAEACQGCGEGSLQDAAGLFVAPSNMRGAFSQGYTGRALTQAEVDALTAEFRTAGGIIDQSLDAQRYLQLRGAGGLTLNESTILLPAGPTRTALFEELVHAGQFRQGVTLGAGQGGVLVFEGQAAEILIQNRRLWQLPNSEVRQVIDNLRNIRAELQRLRAAGQ